MLEGRFNDCETATPRPANSRGYMKVIKEDVPPYMKLEAADPTKKRAPKRNKLQLGFTVAHR